MVPALAAAVSDGEGPPLAFRHADGALLRRVIAETGVDRSAPGPAWSDYFGALFEALVRRIADALSLSPSAAETLGTILKAALVATVAAAVAVVVVAAFRAFARRRSAVSERLFSSWSAAPRASASGRDRAGWEHELAARLSRRDLAGALEAIWWWFAASALPDRRVDASWTTGDLVRESRRRELVRDGAALDVLLYGRTPPSLEDVAACFARLRERFA